jgi:hypothetical protein
VDISNPDVQVGDETQPTQTRLRLPPQLQMAIVFVTHALILASVWLLIHFGGTGSKAPPAAFVVLELLILAVVGGVATIEWGPWFWRMTVTRKSTQPVSRGGWWGKHRDHIMPVVISGLYVMTCLSFYKLVAQTGGGLESPFIPLLVSPAIYGPFIANRPLMIGGMLTLNAAVIAVAVYHAPATPAKSYPAASWLYAAVSIVVIVIAGAISAAKLKADEADVLQEAVGAALPR